jgi:hypothetical protein
MACDTVAAFAASGAPKKYIVPKKRVQQALSPAHAAAPL